VQELSNAKLNANRERDEMRKDMVELRESIEKEREELQGVRDRHTVQVQVKGKELRERLAHIDQREEDAKANGARPKWKSTKLKLSILGW
jgi:hypothetical protein